MNRQNAIAYLRKKGRKATEEEIKKVLKNGKIYGDPLCLIE